MAKLKSRFVCQECGSQSVKWQGRCPDCGGWNTFVEEVDSPKLTSTRMPSAAPSLLSSIDSKEEIRFSSGMEEFDRVLGGGLVSGSLVLIGGAPGIGKSTLLLQAASAVSRHKGTILYVSGEESLQQTKLRAGRLGLDGEKLYLLSEVNLQNIIQQIEILSPSMLVVDSIQTTYCDDLSTAPGSVSQIRECTSRLQRIAKKDNITTLIVGHVTKDGSIAGPRVLEHIVDTVLYFEGEGYQNFRLLRAVKNRFGSTNEVGIFEMGGSGLKEIKNPSEFFLAQRLKKSAGSVIVPVIEGSRPLLVELQALVSKTGFGIPARKSNGFDPNRLALMLAVVEKRAGIFLSNSDVFVNVVSGIKIEETASDLGLALAVVSSSKEAPLDPNTVIIGEVGLAGEVRAVPNLDIRIQEAEKLGFKKIIVPSYNLTKQINRTNKVELIGIETIREAIIASGITRKEV
ncbi:MAG: DNA repair protein RadA [Firmicutes bacterium]|nr:DNA repair protein RadA [Bacillota bacterium]